jgi:predicted transcriptional regulator
MINFRLDSLVENKAITSAKDKSYTAYVAMYNDADPSITLAKFCLNYANEKDFAVMLANSIAKYQASTTDIDAVRAVILDTLAKASYEVKG